MTETLDSHNPATGDVVGSVPVTPLDEIPRTLSLGRGAAGRWRKVEIEERGAMFRKAGRRLMERADELGDLLTREMGKPLRSGVGEVKGCAREIAHKVDEIIEALQPQEVDDGNTRSTIYHDPLGICAAITPWNYPMAMPQWMVLPALMAGNAVILKPSEETPLIGQAYADVLNEFLPDNVLQVVHGADEQGKALVQSDVDLIAFTGSRAAGKHILAAASSGLKRVILELGGKDPLVVLADADVNAAAEFAVNSSFSNSGQMCVSTERIYVAEEIADTFERRLVVKTAKMNVGDGLKDKVRIGPMINERQRKHVLAQIDDALSKGARVVVEGHGPDGCFIAPTILADLTDEMDIMQEETFGPVACISRFSDVDEAVRLANSGPYGLGAVVFGRDEANAESVARRLDAGMIGINKSCHGARGSPWVGAKESGFGYHGSPEGHRQFTQTRVVSSSK